MKLRLSLLFTTMLLAACSGPDNNTSQTGSATSTTAAEEKVLFIYNWSDYIAEDTVSNFEKATGIKVVYDVYDANEMLEAKLMAGDSGYDLVFPSARPFAQRHIQAGVYQPLDKGQLGNYGNLDPALLQSLQDLDPGNTYVVPYMWGTTGLGINVAKVKALLGEDLPLDSWDLLFKPEYASRLAECGISVLDDEQETFAAALIWNGRDANASGWDETELVSKTYAAVRPFIRYFNSSKYIDDLANGDLCLAMGYSGDVFQARDRAAEAGNGVKISYVIPKEGAVRWIDVMAIPKSAPHPGNANRFIDYLLKPEVAASVTNYVAYANPNTAATALVDPEIANDPGVYPTPDVMAKLTDPKTFPPDIQRERVRAWTAIKTGR